MKLLAGVNHVAVLTADLERFVEFYTDVFDLDVVFEESTPALQEECATRVYGSTCCVRPAWPRNWWDATGDPQSPAVLARMLTPVDVANAALWLLDQPDHVQVGELVLGHDRNPWAS